MTRRLCAVAWLLSAVAAFAEPAVRRVVSTVPACTEMLFAIGAGDQVVAVTDYCRYPAEAARREKVGGYSDLSFEKLLSLRPDLVVIADYAHRLRAQCASARLSVLELKTGSISEIIAAIETLGRATGHEQRARAVVESIRADLEKTRAINAGKPPRRALLVIGRPLGSFQQLLGAGPGSFLSELLALAGGDNVLDDARQAWPQINLEAVLARKPQERLGALYQHPSRCQWSHPLVDQ
ncbi:MAG: helical backbone metal receptor [Verrucomicrobiae bacterium]|nr:helical backbone metal receptor [Verrucomicrobiae bacterium]